MNKRDLCERDICSKFISPAIQKAGWDPLAQVPEEVSFTKGRIIVRGKLVMPVTDLTFHRELNPCPRRYLELLIGQCTTEEMASEFAAAPMDRL